MLQRIYAKFLQVEGIMTASPMHAKAYPLHISAGSLHARHRSTLSPFCCMSTVLHCQHVQEPVPDANLQWVICFEDHSCCACF